MTRTRTLARVFAGLLVAATIGVGAAGPAQAKDTGWNGTVAPADGGGHSIVQTNEDTGWNGT
ncbi:MAG: hypothetical protein HOQ22_05395 [Nocardioidaceae bacterium]|nr:hypothetical protein [Nocardioidaceae bacterium]